MNQKPAKKDFSKQSIPYMLSVRLVRGLTELYKNRTEISREQSMVACHKP